MGPPFNGETHSGNANTPNVLCKVATPEAPHLPSQESLPSVHTQEARVGLAIKAKSLPFEDFRETKYQWRLTHPRNKHDSDMK